MAKPRRAKKIFAKFLLILFGLLLGCIVSEIALRVAGYAVPEFYSLDPSRGYALRPNIEGWYRKEGEAYIRINSDGLRDQEHSLTKPQATLRIAVVGDSYPEALSVSMEEAFWSVMKRRLQQCESFSGKHIEVINFGVSGYGTAQELLTLREKVWKYSPDLVLLAMTTNNDITDNSRELKKADIPYFIYKDNHLMLDESFKNSRTFLFRQSRITRLGGWVRDHSRLVQAVIQGHRGLRILLAAWQARHSRGGQTQRSPAKETADLGHKSDLFSRAEELGTDNLIYLEPGNAVWNDAWRVTEGLIREMRDEVSAKGAKFVVVTLSNGPQVFPNPDARENFKKWFGITDLFYPDNRIKSYCMREGIPVLTLAPELQEFAEQNNTFLHGFGKNVGYGHWNATGHRMAGELIAKKICEGQLLK